MADPKIMRDNERVKTISRITTQLGSALLAATVVKVYRAGRLTIETGSWLLIVGVLMLVGWKALALLESES